MRKKKLDGADSECLKVSLKSVVISCFLDSVRMRRKSVRRWMTFLPIAVGLLFIIDAIFRIALNNGIADTFSNSLILCGVVLIVLDFFPYVIRKSLDVK